MVCKSCNVSLLAGQGFSVLTNEAVHTPYLMQATGVTTAPSSRDASSRCYSLPSIVANTLIWSIAFCTRIEVRVAAVAA